MEFLATEFRVSNKEIEGTGRTEIYLADTFKDALGHLLYTRKLRDRRFRIGPTGRTVINGNVAWSLVENKEE